MSFYIPRPRVQKPIKPENNWRSNGDGSKSQAGDWKNGSYSAGGKTFERDKNNNLIVKRPDGSVSTYAPGQSGFGKARQAMEQAGGNWDNMKAYQPRISENGSSRTNDVSDYYSQVAESYQDAQTKALGLSPRPAPYVKWGATEADLANTLGNLGEYYGGLQYDRESMGSANDLALQANQLGKQNAIHNLESGRARIAQEFDERERQDYIRHQQGLRSLDESLSVQGLGGGASESARLAMGNEHQEGMNRLGLGRANALTDLDRQIQSEAFRWDQQAREIEAQNARERAAAQERGRSQAMDWAWKMAQAAEERRWREKQFEASQAANDREWAFKERAYNDGRSDQAYDRDFKTRMYEDDFYGRGFKYDMMRDEMGLKKDKFAWQQASKAARAARSGGSKGSSGNSSSGGYDPVSIMEPIDSVPDTGRRSFGGRLGHLVGDLVRRGQQAVPHLEERGRQNDVSFANKWVGRLEQAKADLKAGRIDVITYNVIARDAEMALRGAGY